MIPRSACKVSRWSLQQNIRYFSAKHENVPGLGGKGNVSLNTNKPTIPPPHLHRVTYEYPPPPSNKPKIPKESSAWKRHVPLFFGIGGILWAGYAVYYFFGESGSSEQTILTPTSFTTYRVTCKQSVSDNLSLIEISPKYAASSSLLKSGATLWNGKSLWSIQVKHPMIQIARNYTPLPVYFMQSDRPDEQPLLRVMGSASDEGRMCLLVKRYADGEMSRYLHSLPVGSDIEIRGPFVEHKFPYVPADSQKLRQPMLDVPTRMPAESQLDPKSGIIKAPNVAMFTAGTGITTAFQMLLSPNNPPRGFTHVFHSSRTLDEVPFKRFMLFLESAGRAKFHIFLDDEKKFITLHDVPSASKYSEETGVIGLDRQDIPISKKYQSVVQQYADRANRDAYVEGVSQAVVCGPPGYITYVSGDPGLSGDQPIGGLLGSRGWDLRNTKRMSDL